MGILTFRCVPLVVVLALVGCGYETARPLRPEYGGPAVRDPLQWPFAGTSIWNTPIGSSARYVAASPPFAKITYLAPDTSYLVRVADNDPERPLAEPGDGPNGAACPASAEGRLTFGPLRVPDDFVLSDAENRAIGSSASFVQPDGHTLIDVSGIKRCTRAGPVFGYRFGSDDLRGEGLQGGEGGSGLSSLGGSLRRGELTNEWPIRHALKVQVWGDRYLYSDATRPDGCFRWPATRCDGAHADPGPAGYHGADPSRTMGSLLALPPNLTPHQLGLATTAGFKLFHALQDFGAYIAGNSGTEGVLLGMNREAVAELADTLDVRLGDTSNTAGRALFDDIAKLVSRLEVVDNNAPDAIGGGGAPRVTPAPPLAP